MTNIFEYSNIFDPNIYSDIHLYQNFDTNIFEYSFVSKNFIRIYSDIRSCNFLDTNVFGYSFVSKSIRMSHSDPRCIFSKGTRLACSLLAFRVFFFTKTTDSNCIVMVYLVFLISELAGKLQLCQKILKRETFYPVYLGCLRRLKGVPGARPSIHYHQCIIISALPSVHQHQCIIISDPVSVEI